MLKSCLSALLIAATAFVGSGCSQSPPPYATIPLFPESMPAAPETVGEVDGMQLLIAWHKSAEFQAELSELVRQRDAAKSAGDLAEVKRLEDLGARRQDTAHQWLGGETPMDPVVERLRPLAADFAREKKLDAIIVRSADLPSSARVVDVTGELIARIPQR